MPIVLGLFRAFSIERHSRDSHTGKSSYCAVFVGLLQEYCWGLWHVIPLTFAPLSWLTDWLLLPTHLHFSVCSTEICSHWLSLGSSAFLLLRFTHRTSQLISMCIWVSFCRTGKMSVLCPFFFKVESRCGQTKWYWWLLSICGDLIWLRGAFKVNFDLSFPRKPLFTALSTCPFCKI